MVSTVSTTPSQPLNLLFCEKNGPAISISSSECNPGFNPGEGKKEESENEKGKYEIYFYGNEYYLNLYVDNGILYNVIIRNNS